MIVGYALEQLRRILVLYGDLVDQSRIMWGTDDEWIPIDRAHRLHGLIGGSRLELIDGAGHLVQEDAPDELNTLLVGWFGKP